MAAPSGPGREAEPVLATDEIQGSVLPGFRTPSQAFVFLEIVSAVRAGPWLRELRVTTLADVLRSRGAAKSDATGDPWLNIALTSAGLRKLLPRADGLTDVPLKQGMGRRSTLLGDPSAPDADGSYDNWLIGGPETAVDVMLLIAGQDRGDVAAEVDRLRRGLPRGVRVVLVQFGQRPPPPDERREPFGFCDDISQPGIRGRLSDAPGDFLDPSTVPGDPVHARPGQVLVWPGEFVFGYPTQHPFDRLRPGLRSHGGPDWTRNGSLLVFRRLRQDVAGFQAFVREAARRIAAEHPALDGVTPESVAAKLMGRWHSGAPLMTSPDTDRPDLGRDPARNNDFSYLARAGNRNAPDPHGLLCPRAAHIRRAYPRDSATPGLTEASIERHRLLRRSIPFVDRRGDVEEQGLLFLAYQTSIERQFEFVTRAWLNNPHLHDTDDGHDPIAGQSFGTRGDRSRIFSLRVPSADGDEERVILRLPHDWVVPTGGAYLFAPAVSTVRVLGASVDGPSGKPREAPPQPSR
ncbi:MAG TPA: Dyp-type peroxidase [Nitriliruptorales bacterium]|nr:Dyp-type peroxidase [Nitriliruptorales bacterium]